MKKTCLISLISIFPLLAIAQNVGIGTSFPGFPLHVVKNSSNAELARFQSSGGYGMILVGNGSAFSALGHTGSLGYVGCSSPQDFSVRTGSIDRMYFQQGTGNVGVGTSTPSCHFDVYMNTPDVNVGRFASNGGFGQVEFTNGEGTSVIGADDFKGYVGTSSNTDFILRAGGQDVVTLKETNKYVGIGTNDPLNLLHVSNSNANVDIARFQNTGGYGQILVTNGTMNTSLGADINMGYVGTNANQDFSIRTNSISRLTVKQGSGNVGIGTTTPNQPLTIKADGTNNMLQYQNNAGTNKWHWWMPSGTDLVLTETAVADYRLTIKPGGNIGIGTATPSEKLHVAGNIKSSGNLNVAGTLQSDNLAGTGTRYVTATSTGLMQTKTTSMQTVFANAVPTTTGMAPLTFLSTTVTLQQGPSIIMFSGTAFHPGVGAMRLEVEVYQQGWPNFSYKFQTDMYANQNGMHLAFPTGMGYFSAFAEGTYTVYFRSIAGSGYTCNIDGSDRYNVSIIQL